jgi:hypothetical protein
MIDYTLSDKFKVQYQTANPFPYIVIDNFLPESLLKSCINEIKKHDEWYSNQMGWVEEFQKNKFYYPNEATNMEDFAKKLPIIKESMEKMMNRELTTKEKIRLTKEAIKLRFNSPEMMTNDTIESILTPNRIEDQGNNLWNVFNTIQEKLIRGGFIYSVNEKRPRTARPINNIINSNKVNTELWELAQSMC